jgi:hypothetical protein
VDYDSCEEVILLELDPRRHFGAAPSSAFPVGSGGAGLDRGDPLVVIELALEGE